MASAVDICNLALSHLGEGNTVSAISPPDGSSEAARCNAFYPIARDVLLGHPRAAWGWATKRAELALLEEDPTAGWAFSYSLPSDCLRPLRVMLPETTDETKTEKFDIETLSNGNLVLYTNAEDPTLVYVSRITDSAKFSPLFVSALSWLLASYLAGPITKDLALAEKCEKRALGMLVDAAAVDSMSRQVTGMKDFTPAGVQARS